MWCLRVGRGGVGASFSVYQCSHSTADGDVLAKIFRDNLVMCLAHTSIAINESFCKYELFMAWGHLKAVELHEFKIFTIISISYLEVQSWSIGI